MTDRLKGCWVAFDRDIREDDAEHLLDAIRMIKGVASVEPNVANADDWMNRTRIRHELGQKILDVVFPDRT